MSPILGTSLCRRCGPKKTGKKEGSGEREGGREEVKEKGRKETKEGRRRKSRGKKGEELPVSLMPVDQP